MLVVMDRRGAGERGPPRIYADGDGAKQNGVNQLSTRLGANQDTSLPFVGDNVPEIIELLSGGVVTRRLRLIKDQVGTVELVTDVSTGEIVQRLEHDEFGRVLSDSNPGLQPFGFAGGLYDLETRLVRFGARDYDPAIGRWTARDPVRNASGANWYVFANGAPTAAADATGLKPRKPSRWDVFGVICDIVTLGNCPIPGFLGVSMRRRTKSTMRVYGFRPTDTVVARIRLGQCRTRAQSAFATHSHNLATTNANNRFNGK
jgi:RHS repeat-associated protein